MHENTGKNQEGQDLVALIQERFGLLSQEMNASVLILAPIAPALSGSSPALPLNEPMPCWPRHHLGWFYWHHLSRRNVNEITGFIARCQTFRSIEDQCPVDEVADKDAEDLIFCDLVVTSPCCRTGRLQSHTTWDDSEIVTGYLHVLYHLYHLQQDYVRSSVSTKIVCPFGNGRTTVAAWCT